MALRSTPGPVSLGRAEGDVEDVAEMHLVDHLDQQPGRGLAVGDDEYSALRIHGIHALDVGTYRAQVDRAALDPDLAVREDLDRDTGRLGLSRLLASRAIHHQRRLLHEDGDDDEEDEQ